MQAYKVIWEIECYVETPEDAARWARDVQLDPASLATYFTVVAPDGQKHPVHVDTARAER